MCSYLVALAIGALEKRKLGPRSDVWSEKETVEQGAYEFAETEKFLSTAEEVCGKYDWKRYDILLLPPSFPYGGMENPCLTFVTPTLLAGDRSLVNVIVHEIAHSWMGNLVSPKTWAHFWMNEGFTVFVERKVLKKLWGDKFMNLHAITGDKHLRDSIAQFGKDHNHTCLVPDLTDTDPDDAFSSVPYEKGFQFLWFLQSIVGEKDMDQMILDYVAKFANQSVTTSDFESFFTTYFASKLTKEQFAQIDWKTWITAPGHPSVAPKFDHSLLDDAFKLSQALIKSGYDTAMTELKGGDEYNLGKWSSSQLVAFLEKFEDLQHEYLANTKDKAEAHKHLHSIISALDKAYDLTHRKNVEIRFRWFLVCIGAGYDAINNDAIALALEQGRMKFVRPLYRALYNAGDKARELAINTFQKHRGQYHIICSKMVAKDLKLSS